MQLLPKKRRIPVPAGWMSDVMSIIQSLNRFEFTNRDIYAFEWFFKRLYPKNRNIKDKIRQQLQYLAKAGLLEHLGAGRWQRLV